ncbi:MAG: TRAP transporter small permease [Syntrophobacterales bacterium]|nr:TRAP transporter small permease [Syntrophobacterales bacterium]
MQSIINKVQGLGKFLDIFAGIAITFIMLLTVLDVILRSFRMPVVGTYELVAFSGAVVIGFAVPLTTLLKGHVLVDFFVAKFPEAVRNTVNITTRLLGIGLFSILCWNLIKMGMDFYRTGEVSLTLQLPFYPMAFGLGFCALVQCLILIAQILQVIGGSYE